MTLSGAKNKLAGVSLKAESRRRKLDALAKEAQDAAGDLLERDPDLAAHPAIACRLAELFELNGEALN